MPRLNEHTLEHAVRSRLKRYFSVLNPDMDHPTYALYDLLLREMEKPLIEETLQFCHHNQSKAAKILGMNRNTLRRKILFYGLESSLS